MHNCIHERYTNMINRILKTEMRLSIYMNEQSSIINYRNICVPDDYNLFITNDKIKFYAVAVPL